MGINPDDWKKMKDMEKMLLDFTPPEALKRWHEMLRAEERGEKMVADKAEEKKIAVWKLAMGEDKRFWEWHELRRFRTREEAEATLEQMLLEIAASFEKYGFFCPDIRANYDIREVTA